jgi:hypothetical protein
VESSGGAGYVQMLSSFKDVRCRLSNEGFLLYLEENEIG